MDQRVGFGIVKRRVADLVLVDAKIVMKKNADFARLSARFVTRTRRRKMFSWLATVSLQTISMPSCSFVECDVGDQRFGQISQISAASRRRISTRIRRRPKRRSERETFGVILLADVREINVADLIFVVEVDEQAAVADGNVSHRPVARDRLFDRGVELLLDGRAEADDLGDHSPFGRRPRSAGCRCGSRRYSASVVLGIRDRVIDLAFLPRNRYLRLSSSPPTLRPRSARLSTVLCDQRVEMRDLLAARRAICRPEIEDHGLALRSPSFCTRPSSSVQLISPIGLARGLVFERGRLVRYRDRRRRRTARCSK